MTCTELLALSQSCTCHRQNTWNTVCSILDIQEDAHWDFLEEYSSRISELGQPNQFASEWIYLILSNRLVQSPQKQSNQLESDKKHLGKPFEILHFLNNCYNKVVHSMTTPRNSSPRYHCKSYIENELSAPADQQCAVSVSVENRLD